MAAQDQASIEQLFQLADQNDAVLDQLQGIFDDLKGQADQLEQECGALQTRWDGIRGDLDGRVHAIDVKLNHILVLVGDAPFAQKVQQVAPLRGQIDQLLGGQIAQVGAGLPAAIIQRLETLKFDMLGNRTFREWFAQDILAKFSELDAATMLAGGPVRAHMQNMYDLVDDWGTRFDTMVRNAQIQTPGVPNNPTGGIGTILEQITGGGGGFHTKFSQLLYSRVGAGTIKDALQGLGIEWEQKVQNLMKVGKWQDGVFETWRAGWGSTPVPGGISMVPTAPALVPGDIGGRAQDMDVFGGFCDSAGHAIDQMFEGFRGILKPDVSQDLGTGAGDAAGQTGPELTDGGDNLFSSIGKNVLPVKIGANVIPPELGIGGNPMSSADITSNLGV